MATRRAGHRQPQRWPPDGGDGAARADLVYVCTPTTPTGASLPAAAIADIARALPRCRVIVDQSFLSLGDDAHELGSALPDNAIRVRSLTKDHAFPGVRVGYAIATAALVASLEAARPTWTTSAAAQAAAIAACELDDFVADSRRRLIADREALAAALRACGLAPEPSRAPFLAVAVRDAGAARDALLGAHAIQVRHCQSFGLPDHLRVAALRGADRDRLIAAVRALGLAPASVAAARVDRQSSSCQPTPSARSKRLSS